MASQKDTAEFESSDRSSENIVLSDLDRKLLNAFHNLNVQSDIETAEDLASFMRKFVRSEQTNSNSSQGGSFDDHRNARGTDVEPEQGDMRMTQAAIMTPYQYPRISSFSGDSSKGEVNWECFQFEIESLESDGVYSPEQILHGIRKAAKGEAAEIIRRLGTGVTVRQVMHKLKSTYGNIETRESIMQKFYSCTQQMGETVAAYASRLEDFFDKAVSLGGLRRTDTNVLKGVLYQGLRRSFKQLATYKFDTVTDYDKFKIELRIIESEMKDERGEERSRPCRPAVSSSVVKDKENSELGEVKDLLMALNDRIQKLEESQKSGSTPEAQYMPQVSSGFKRPYRGGLRGRGNQSFRHGGREAYKPSRPIVSNTFSPTCWKCNRKGHVQSNCPN